MLRGVCLRSIRSVWLPKKGVCFLSATCRSFSSSSSSSPLFSAASSDSNPLVSSLGTASADAEALVRNVSHGMPLHGTTLSGRAVGGSRSFSSSADSHALTMADLDFSRLVVMHKQGTPTPMPPLSELRFGQFFSDHFLEVDWDSHNGWMPPFVRPLQPMQIHPGSSSLHYGLEVFEGMKAFKAASGEVLLFRPDMSAARLLKSAKRMALPTFNEKTFVKLIAALLRVDEKFIPQQDGFSIYIRPVLFSTHASLGVGAPTSAKLIVVLSPCGPYYATGFKPVQLLAETRFTRAFPGGVGDCKVGGNYGPTIYPQSEGAKKGCGQLLWLFPFENDFLLTEAGTMNIFVHWINRQGEKELVSPPLKRNLILPGVTRQSVLELARQEPGLKVSERDIFMEKDFLAALAENRVLEAFGTGTAAVLTSINSILYKGKHHAIPLGKEGNAENIGPLAEKILNAIYDVQYGRSHRFPEWTTSVSSLLD